jgi:hypothetical protein
MILIKNITKLQLYFNYTIIFNFLLYISYNPNNYCSLKKDIYDSMFINILGLVLSLILYIDENNNRFLLYLFIFITLIKFLNGLIINEILFDIFNDNEKEDIDTLVIKTFIVLSYYLFILGSIKLFIFTPFLFNI